MTSDISHAGAQSWAARVLAALAVAALLSTPPAAPADEPQVYVWRDRDGTVRFSTVAPFTEPPSKSETLNSKSEGDSKQQTGKL